MKALFLFIFCPLIFASEAIDDLSSLQDGQIIMKDLSIVRGKNYSHSFNYKRDQFVIHLTLSTPEGGEFLKENNYYNVMNKRKTASDKETSELVTNSRINTVNAEEDIGYVNVKPIMNPELSESFTVFQDSQDILTPGFIISRDSPSLKVDGEYFKIDSALLKNAVGKANGKYNDIQFGEDITNITIVIANPIIAKSQIIQSDSVTISELVSKKKITRTVVAKNPYRSDKDSRAVITYTLEFIPNETGKVEAVATGSEDFHLYDIVGSDGELFKLPKAGTPPDGCE